MVDTEELARLRIEHTPAAIASRLTSPLDRSYVGDGVLGAIDGAVTTFAIVAGSLGAGISSGIALALGFANVVADGFSMAAGNYLKAKADREILERARRQEEQHVDALPEGEREEVRQLFSRKGFEGAALEEAVDTITSDRKRWVETMLTEELGLPLESPVPFRAAGTTFLAFLAAGSIPLLPLGFLEGRTAFTVSAWFAGVVFLGIGLVKARIARASAARSAVETLLVGGGAALLAYLVGNATKDFVP